MSAQQTAQELGVSLEPLEPGYLNLCIRTGNLLITSGHTSDLTGVLGKNVTVEQGYEAAADCARKILRSVHNTHGTLDGLRVLKLLGISRSSRANEARMSQANRRAKRVSSTSYALSRN